MNKELINPMTCTDVYKLGHLEQFSRKTTKVYSHLLARSDRKFPFVLNVGLQYYLKKYLTIRPEMWMINDLLARRKGILGMDIDKQSEKQLRGLPDLGYFPLLIKAPPEGMILPVKNALMTIINTHPDYYWLGGFFESLLLKVWNTDTVGSADLTYKRLVKRFSDETCDNGDHLPFAVHDFGYRGCSSEETAALSGMCHLVNFLGTDTVCAIDLIEKYYGGSAGPIGLSVPASEHSVMCSFGPEHELEAFPHMMEVYPEGILSIVSDTYNLWNVLTNYAKILKPAIMRRKGLGGVGPGKVVFRPDSGDPLKILCGDLAAGPGTPERKGAIRLIDEEFGATVNKKGYRVFDPHAGLIYGDGMYFERFESILTEMKNMGYASSNLVIGIGGLLLQQHNRDEQGYALKATYAEVDGKGVELFKDPITDSKKKSLKGLLQLNRDERGNIYTKDCCTWEEEAQGLLVPVYKDGKVLVDHKFDDIRARVAAQA